MQADGMGVNCPGWDERYEICPGVVDGSGAGYTEVQILGTAVNFMPGTQTNTPGELREGHNWQPVPKSGSHILHREDMGCDAPAGTWKFGNFGQTGNPSTVVGLEGNSYCSLKVLEREDGATNFQFNTKFGPACPAVTTCR